MSISAAATQPWSWPNGMDPSAATNGSPAGASAFQASLLQWQAATAAGTQTTTSATASTTATGSTQNEPTGPAECSTTTTITTNRTAANRATAVRSSPRCRAWSATLPAPWRAGPGPAAPPVPTRRSSPPPIRWLRDLAKATQANAGAAGGGTATATSATADVAASSTTGTRTSASIQSAENPLAADIAQALQAYGVNQAAGGNILASV